MQGHIAVSKGDTCERTRTCLSGIVLSVIEIFASNGVLNMSLGKEENLESNEFQLKYQAFVWRV